jgi:hypothetical protein
MKRILFILAVSLFTVSAMAQTEKGKIRLGGDLDLSFLNVKPDIDGAKATNTFNLGVNGGYFVIDNLSVNAGLAFGYEKAGGDDDAATAFGFSLGARYYLQSKIFFGGDFDIISSKYGDEDSFTGTGFTPSIGYAWFVKDNIAIEPALGYRLGLSNKDDGTKFNGFGLNIGLSVHF